MEAIANWLERLRQAQPETLRQKLLPVLSPGFRGLDLHKGLLTTDPKGLLMAVLRYPDVGNENFNGN